MEYTNIDKTKEDGIYSVSRCGKNMVEKQYIFLLHFFEELSDLETFLFFRNISHRTRHS